MNEREFETMLRFKAGAGIAVLAAWVRELRTEYERKDKALSCVVMRMRMFDMSTLMEPQQRYLRHTHDIAKNALNGTNDAAREMVGGLTQEQRDLAASELGQIMGRVK